jgi:2-oxoisovalerate dehydrogenase E2 component (dihydrolipoyl transacylase)
MSTEVKLPDLGEGIEDVTISRWRVKEGDSVNAGDVILEVATDKVDTEVSAPASGTLLQIKFREGELAPAHAVLAYIGAAGESVNGAATAVPAVSKPLAEVPHPMPIAPVAPAEPPSDGREIKATPVAKRLASELGVALEQIQGTGVGGNITKEDVQAYAEQTKVAPAQPQPAAPVATPAPATPPPGDATGVPRLTVQRLAAEHNLNLAQAFPGRPLSSLTRYEVLAAAGKAVPTPEQIQASAAPATTAPATEPPAPQPPVQRSAPAAPVSAKTGEELIPHSRMRQLVAQNTSKSLFTAPHVTSMWDVDMSAVIAHRKAKKNEFAAAGVNLTITAYLVQAIIAGLQAVPAANAAWSEEGVIIKRYYNIGMAVAVPADKNGLGGLIVPVIKNAGDLNLLGLARAVNDLAERARANKLTGEDLQGGTFTLTNYGTSGSRFQTPIIVQPQVGILGTGAIEKRPVVVSNGSPLEANLGDYLTFKPMMTLGFSYDHRVLDGATADAFCAAVKAVLERWQ